MDSQVQHAIKHSKPVPDEQEESDAQKTLKKDIAELKKKLKEKEKELKKLNQAV
jgi:septal ring factor EnvC (AmiA/AmiB activator)